MRKVGGSVTVSAAKSGATVGVGASARALGVFAADSLGLGFYKMAPDIEVSIREIEGCTQDRLRALHVIDRACSYESRSDTMESVRPKVLKEVINCNLWLEYPSGLDSESFPDRKAEFMRRDAISHFMLRLAFCKTKEARDWLLWQEQRLFVLRFEALRPEAQEAFIAASGLKCKKIDMSVPSSDPAINHASIQRATPAARIFRDGKAPEYDNTFYLMHFAEVDPKLISNRKVVILGGNAYVPSSSLKSILSKKFKDHLAASLDVAFQGLPVALADPRIGGFIRVLQEYGRHMLVAGKPTVSQEDLGEALNLANFEELMARSFPPCMRRAVEKQREMKKHLKHAGRLQLRPFLKECGFGIEDSFTWWKQELCRDPTIDSTKFDKDYTYDIEHAYGKKGHLQGQNSFGCAKILGFPDESGGQVHGCPFKVLDPSGLRQQMLKWKVPSRHVSEMEKLITQGKHYQLACVEFFKANHEDNEGSAVGNTPGAYFRDSCVFHKQKKDKEKEAKA